MNKETKTPGSPNPQPLANAGFTLFLANTNTMVQATNHAGFEALTDAAGEVCFEGLVPGLFDVEETTVPFGYAIAGNALTEDVLVVGGTDCAGSPPVAVTVTNDSLTEISIHVEAQVPGATISSIECFLEDGVTSIGGNLAAFSDPADLQFVGLDALREGTYKCTIIIDP